MLVRYLQLRYALRAQFPDLYPTYSPVPLLEVILGGDPTKLTSSLYNILLKPSTTKLAYQTRWEVDLGAMEDYYTTIN